MSSNNRLYNYLVNTLGISKDFVLEHIDSRLEDLIKKHIENKINSNWTKKVIATQVSEFVKNGRIGQWYRQESFESIVEDVTRDIIERTINKKYKLEFFVKKDEKDAKKVVGRTGC